MLRSFLHRPLGSKVILLSAIVYLGVSTLWQKPCAATSDGNVCGYKTEWHGIGVWAGLFAVAILLWEVLPVLAPRLSMRGWPTAVIASGLGIALVVLTIAKLIADNAFLTGYAWIGFALAVAIMLTATLRVRFRWTTRKHPEARARIPAREAGPGPGSDG